MQEVLSQFPAAAVAIQVDGPPTYDGHRVILRGDPDGFRWLANVLLKMANDVSDPSKPAHIGWHLLLNGDFIPQLQLDDEWFLSLNCGPDENELNLSRNE